SQHPKTPYADKSPDELTPEEMREEIAFLRAQNDYIKKLRALIVNTDRIVTHPAKVKRTHP
ncbi:hypothetical protein M6G53_25380, partial [Serratia nevei]|nr:hypothetical protein [Serratia nevei]